MKEQFVLHHKENTIAIVEISNEKKKNALNRELLSELETVLRTIENDDGVRVVVITGKNDMFCSGMDIQWLLKEDSIGMIKSNLWIQQIFNYIENYKKPMVAAVSGSATGAGMFLALICDLRVAADNAVLGLPEIKVGIPLYLAGSKILQRYLGIGRIIELVYTGKMIDASKAMELGLINKVVSREDLMKEALSLAGEISEFSPLALQILKRSLHASYEMSEKALLNCELDSLGFYWNTEDRKEGFRSFFEKRRPIFKGM